MSNAGATINYHIKKIFDAKILVCVSYCKYSIIVLVFLKILKLGVIESIKFWKHDTQMSHSNPIDFAYLPEVLKRNNNKKALLEKL